MISRLASAVAAVLFMSATAAGAPSAAAEIGTPCGEDFAALREDALVVPITGGKVDKERTGLVRIVDDAATLADAGKTSDAVVKLTNLQTKVDDLAAAGRIDTDSAARLGTDIAAVTGCLAAG